MHSVEIVLGLVLLGAIVAALAARLSAPAPSLLVLAGLGVGLLPGVPDIQLDPDVVALVVLPPLLYAAGQDLSLSGLRSVKGPVTLLAVGLVLATAFAVAGLGALLLDLPLPVGLVLGAVLASTDPVAVTALARTLRLPARLEALVTAESLFNDATSLLLFRIALGLVVVDEGVSWGHVSLQVVRLGLGGALVGVVVALAAAALRRRTEDASLETVTALLTPYSAYVLAEALGSSGVTAVVVTGIGVGALGTRLSSADTRLQMNAVNGTVVFLLESVVFSLIGLQLPSLVRALDVPVQEWLLPAVALTLAVGVMRAIWVFPMAAVLQRRAGDTLSWRAPAVITWAGTRGVVPLAAALSIPLTVDGGEPFPHRELLLVLAISVSVLTLVVQGLTLKPLTLLAGVAEGPEQEHLQQVLAEQALVRAALARVQELADTEAIPPFMLHRLEGELTTRAHSADVAVEEVIGETDHQDRVRGRSAHDYRALRRDVLGVEMVRLARLLADGEISEPVWRTLQRDIDLRAASLTAHPR